MVNLWHRMAGRRLVSRGLTIRLSRTCFATPTTWQIELAMLSAALRKSAYLERYVLEEASDRLGVLMEVDHERYSTT